MWFGWAMTVARRCPPSDQCPTSWTMEEMEKDMKYHKSEKWIVLGLGLELSDLWDVGLVGEPARIENSLTSTYIVIVLTITHKHQFK